MSQYHRQPNPCSMVGRLICNATKLKITSIYYIINLYYFNNSNQINILFSFSTSIRLISCYQSFVIHSIQFFIIEITSFARVFHILTRTRTLFDRMDSNLSCIFSVCSPVVMYTQFYKCTTVENSI
jgi:flagellar biosynthesis regulator FlbT